MRDDFIWGAATCAFQIEGGYREDGKGDSIWDVLTHEPGRTKNGDTGDITCDHYHRFREDIKLMAESGISAYRFSISWSRVLPNGVGAVNEAGIRFYSELIDELLKNHIVPYLTLYHWDLPHELLKRGGWLNPESPEWFAQYTELIAEHFGNRVNNYITINEPNNVIEGMTPGGTNAPGLAYSLRDRLEALHNLLKAHGKAVRVLRMKIPTAKIGIAPCSFVHCPADEKPETVEAARKWYFSNEKGNLVSSISLYTDPVFLGDYPKEYYEYYSDILPDIKAGDMELISQPLDFCFQNIYSGIYIRSGADGNAEAVRYTGPKNMLGWNIVPKALYWGPKYLYERYGVPIMITENGYPCPDAVSVDGKVHDPGRVDFMIRYIDELMLARKDGVEIEGYFYWSFMDNLEWELGYEPRFGLVYVDFESQKRIPKDSFFAYRNRILHGSWQ